MIGYQCESRLRPSGRPGKVITVADIEIVHPIDVEEASAWFASMATTFLARPQSSGSGADDAKRRRGWSSIRHWGVRADGRWVATLGTMTRILSVPGRDGGTELVAADALTMVTVAGTHRRRGLLRRMLSESLDAARQRGDAVAILFAAEWAIYGRFGYAPASFAASYELDPRLRGASLPMAAAGGGTLRQVERAELGKYGPEIFEAARRQRAGNIDREPFWWERTLGLQRTRAEQGARPDPNVRPAHRSRGSRRLRRLGRQQHHGRRISGCRCHPSVCCDAGGIPKPVDVPDQP